MGKALVYIQSGGPTAVINTSLYGVIKEAKKHPNEISGIYGSLNGIEGLIDNKVIDLGKEKDETIELLPQTPGAALGTTRYKLPKDIKDPVYQKIICTVQKHNIGYIFVNGGNDSMDTCHKLSILCKELNLDIKVMGIPKTIDNDLAVTDHCVGFPSAAKSVINNVKQICTDARCYKRGKVFIIEIMGRNAGWLAASVDLLPQGCRPDYMYLPENSFNMDEFLKDVKETYERKGHCIVSISEGIHFERDTSTARVDAFNHVQLGGAADALAKVVEDKLNLPTRSIELSLIQRADSILASKVDHDEAIACSKLAFDSALKGETGKMVGVIRKSNNPYTVEYKLLDISKIANVEKTVPFEMIGGKTGMTDAFKKYLRPLIQGEIDVKYKDGIVETATLEKHLI